MGNLSLELKEMARNNGLCDKWFGEWVDESDDATLFDKYKRGIDFSIEHDWISNEFIKSRWDKEVLQDNNIFVDDKDMELENTKGTVIINGDCDLTFNYNLFTVSDLYARHNSIVRVTAKDHARIMVNLYDNAIVEIDCDYMAKVYVYQHSKDSKIVSIGRVIPLIRKEFKK